MTRTKFYAAYRSMMNRCIYPNQKCYKYYGGRGINCVWNSFDEFKADMYESYLQHINEFGEKNTTLDRIDNNGNYCKENCRWATWNEQLHNKRNTEKLEYNGKKQTIVEWANEYNIPVSTLFYRIRYAKWDISKSLNT